MMASAATTSMAASSGGGDGLMDVLGDGSAMLVILSSPTPEAPLPAFERGWNAVVRFSAIDPETDRVITTSEQLMGMPKHDHGDDPDPDVMRHSQSAFLRSPSDAGEVESRSASRELPTVQVSGTASVSRTTSSGQLSLADGGDAAVGGGADDAQATATKEPAIGPLNRREAFLSVPPSTAHGHSHSEGDRFCYLDHGDGGADGSPSGTFGTLAPVPSDDDDLDADVDPASFDIRIGRGFGMTAWEAAVKRMHVGDVARLDCSAVHSDAFVNLVVMTRRSLSERGRAHCCGHDLADELTRSADIAQYRDRPLRFELELLAAQAPGEFLRDPWECTLEERMDEVHRLKEEGNTLYRAGRVRRAATRYERALAFLESVFAAQDTSAWEAANMDAEVARTVRQTLRLNYAAAMLKMGDYAGVVRECSDVLAEDPDNYKATYRRALAWLRNGRDADRALEVFKQLKGHDKIDPLELARESRIATEMLKRAHTQERRAYARMFY